MRVVLVVVSGCFRLVLGLGLPPLESGLPPQRTAVPHPLPSQASNLQPVDVCSLEHIPEAKLPLSLKPLAVSPVERVSLIPATPYPQVCHLCAGL